MWLIARDCLTQPSLSTGGELLGQQALNSTRLLRMPNFETAILTEWVHIAQSSGRREIVARLTNELQKIDGSEAVSGEATQPPPPAKPDE